MDWPEGIAARPIVLDDADALAELRAAIEKVDDEGEHEDAEDVRDWLRHPWFDGPHGSIGLWSGDRLAAWAVIWCGPVQRRPYSSPARSRSRGAIETVTAPPGCTTAVLSTTRPVPARSRPVMTSGPAVTPETFSAGSWRSPKP